MLVALAVVMGLGLAFSCSAAWNEGGCWERRAFRGDPPLLVLGASLCDARCAERGGPSAGAVAPRTPLRCVCAARAEKVPLQAKLQGQTSTAAPTCPWQQEHRLKLTLSRALEHQSIWRSAVQRRAVLWRQLRRDRTRQAVGACAGQRAVAQRCVSRSQPARMRSSASLTSNSPRSRARQADLRLVRRPWAVTSSPGRASAGVAAAPAPGAHQRGPVHGSDTCDTRLSRAGPPSGTWSVRCNSDPHRQPEGQAHRAQRLLSSLCCHC